MSSPKYNKSILNLYDNEEKVLARGFVPLSNTIHLYKDELELTWKEIGLITSVLSSVFQNKPIIKDKDIVPDSKLESKRKTFTYQRNSLKAKGYLETKVIKDYDNGFRTLGIKYDFSGLWIKIKELVVRDEKTSDENIEKPKEENNSNKNSSIDDTSPQADRSHSGQKSNNFLQEYNKLHKQIVGTELNFEKQTSYKEHILKHYYSRNRELSEININDIQEAYKDRLSKDEFTSVNKSLAFQDIIGGLLLWASENNESSNNQFEIKKTKKNKTTRKVKTLDEVLDEYNLSHKPSTGYRYVCTQSGGKEQRE